MGGEDAKKAVVFNGGLSVFSREGFVPKPNTVGSFDGPSRKSKCTYKPDVAIVRL